MSLLDDLFGAVSALKSSFAADAIEFILGISAVILAVAFVLGALAFLVRGGRLLLDELGRFRETLSRVRRPHG